MSVEVRPVDSARDRRALLGVGARLHGHDPCWVPPLYAERRRALDPARHPFFRHGEAQFFVGWRGGRPVGSISALIDRLAADRWPAPTGFFGSFDAPDDREVVAALWSACEGWLRARGIARVLGPFDHNINGEVGVLVDGFDAPTAVLTRYNPPYYGPRLESLGLRKAKDLFAWRFRPEQLGARRRAALGRPRRPTGVVLRSLDRRRLGAEVRAVAALYNEAWDRNWGHLPLTEEEADDLGRALGPVLDSELAILAERDGELVGMSISVPDVNPLIRRARGRALPFLLGWLALRARGRWPARARTLLLGVRPGRRRAEGLGNLVGVLLAETYRRLLERGYRECEFSWTLEENRAIHRAARLLGARRYKTFRIYEKELTG